ncbi:IS3 family transposase [Mammaliicoccus sciuri]
MNQFRTLSELDLQLSDYINGYTYHRIHGALNYQFPVNYKVSTT